MGDVNVEEWNGKVIVICSQKPYCINVAKNEPSIKHYSQHQNFVAGTGIQGPCTTFQGKQQGVSGEQNTSYFRNKTSQNYSQIQSQVPFILIFLSN